MSNTMPHSGLQRGIAISVGLSLAHNADHFLRGDFDAARNPEAALSLMTSAAIYLLVGLTWYAWRHGRLSTHCWSVLGLAGLVLAGLAHWNPGAEQNLAYIYRGYSSPLAGTLALAVFIALTLALVWTTLEAVREARRG